MDSYSGTVLVRMPKQLHQKVATLAKENGVSINQYIIYLLTMGTTEDTILGSKENHLLGEGFSVGQDQISGKKGNEVGRLVGKVVAEKLGITLEKGSNKGLFNKRIVVIKSARIGNSMFGITNTMTKEIQDVILVKETTEGIFDMYLVEFNKFKDTGTPTRSKGSSSGRVTNYRVKNALSNGKKIGTVSIDLP